MHAWLTECEGLATAGLCPTDEVPALSGGLEDSLLDGKERGDATVVEGLDCLGAQAEVGDLGRERW